MTTNQLTLFNEPLPPSIQEAFGGLSNIPEKSTVPQLSFRGKVWRIVLNGEEQIAKNNEGDPVQSVKLVMLNLHKQRSRAYYKGAYETGKSQAPTCWSNDGVAPDPSSLELQSKACANCPQAAKGSKVSDSGKAMAACGTFRRVAVVPSQDLNFEPLLLKIPQTSLWDKENGENEAKGFYAFDQYMDMLRTRGITHTAAVVTRVKFDARAEYPKLLFGADHFTPTEDHAKIKELLADPRVESLLTVSANAVAARDEEAMVESGEEPAAAQAVKAAPAAKPAAVKPTVQKNVPPPKKAAPAPAPAKEPDDDLALPAVRGNGKGAPVTIEATAAPQVVQSDPAGLGSLLNGWDD